MTPVPAVVALAALAAATGHAAEPSLIADRASLQEAQRRGAIVWDLRSAEEYRASHIPGAVNIPPGCTNC